MMHHKKSREIDPDEIFIDSRNLPNFDTYQFEGRIEKPISRGILYLVAGIFVVMALIFLAQSWNLSIIHGKEYLLRSEKNILRPVPLFAGRGVIYDRMGNLLVWNAPSTNDTVARREYTKSQGLSHILGYIKYPSKDNNGFYYQEDFEGIDGAEKYFNDKLSGVNGSRLIEVDAHNNIVSENIVRPAIQGENITLSIDERVQSVLNKNIADITKKVGFSGGAGIIMNIYSGEIIALTSYPEYDAQTMSDKTDSAKVNAMLKDAGLPFLNRAVDGLYAPGSTLKPYVALGVLAEKIIEPSTVIMTVGSVTVPNPYDSTKSSVFKDWKNHGAVDMRKAIAVSSDAYFYIVGGGYKDQKGLGIINIDRYLKMFGFGTIIPNDIIQGKMGTIPTPEWKKKTFDEDWYVGNTYHTSIGQYGVQVTPLQMTRAVAAIANEGSLLVPTIIKDDKTKVESVINIAPEYFKVVREGMRLSVTDGISKVLDVPYVSVATKSGTAELGVSKSHVNSWITGFFPYEKPHYAFVIVLEKGSVHNLVGASAVMKAQLDWMNVHTPEYFAIENN